MRTRVTAARCPAGMLLRVAIYGIEPQVQAMSHGSGNCRLASAAAAAEPENGRQVGCLWREQARIPPLHGCSQYRVPVCRAPSADAAAGSDASARGWLVRQRARSAEQEFLVAVWSMPRGEHIAIR